MFHFFMTFIVFCDSMSYFWLTHTIFVSTTPTQQLPHDHLFLFDNESEGHRQRGLHAHRTGAGLGLGLGVSGVWEVDTPLLRMSLAAYQHDAGSGRDASSRGDARSVGEQTVPSTSSTSMRTAMPPTATTTTTTPPTTLPSLPPSVGFSNSSSNNNSDEGSSGKGKVIRYSSHDGTATTISSIPSDSHPTTTTNSSNSNNNSNTSNTTSNSSSNSSSNSNGSSFPPADNHSCTLVALVQPTTSYRASVNLLPLRAYLDTYLLTFLQVIVIASSHIILYHINTTSNSSSNRSSMYQPHHNITSSLTLSSLALASTDYHLYNLRWYLIASTNLTLAPLTPLTYPTLTYVCIYVCRTLASATTTTTTTTSLPLVFEPILRKENTTKVMGVLVMKIMTLRMRKGRRRRRMYEPAKQKKPHPSPLQHKVICVERLWRILSCQTCIFNM